MNSNDHNENKSDDLQFATIHCDICNVTERYDLNEFLRRFGVNNPSDAEVEIPHRHPEFIGLPVIIHQKCMSEATWVINKQDNLE